MTQSKSQQEPRSGASESTTAAANAVGNPLWGGRFSEATDVFVQEFTASIEFDKRLANHDIDGSLAHARMLASVGVLSSTEAGQICAGLETVRSEIAAGQFRFSVALEDVHMNVESRLIELIGDTGKKLHTGRSRNDQVATDLRLFLRSEIDRLLRDCRSLLEALARQADRHAATIMPGFTHLQAAQPVTFGHHLLAWAAMLERDVERLTDCRKRTNRLPLGSAALAGTTFPIDRNQVAEALDFEAVCDNSLDAVSDRDFVIEFLSATSLMLVHFSRWCEELVLWTSPQFGFVSLPDRFCTGSSIMPQKKNPDVPELIRGKCGRTTGALMSLLMLMKGQPLAYNKDNQEDKEPLFDAVDTLSNCLTAMIGMVEHLEAQPDAMRAAAAAGFSTATDLADYLVRAGVPFRDAHGIVGHAVALAVERGCDLAELPLRELEALSPAIEADVFDVLTLEGSVAARNHVGGTAPERVRKAAAALAKRMGAA
ncbi:MAG: argininosuccinate lyase [Pseudomonadota bacterium]